MKTNLIAEMEITDFEKQHDLEICINERKVAKNNPNRYYAKFNHSEVKDGRFLIGTFGNGYTLDEALRNYASEISLKTIVINSYGENRREIEVPRLIHTKSIHPLIGDPHAR